MTKPPDVSILIVNWNSRDFLRKCLTSIYAHTHSLSFEVVVVDNASFDGAAEMVAADFPQVRFLQSDCNLGFAGANNYAFQRSSGRVLLLLNPDTQLVDDAIGKMLEALKTLPDAGIISCKLLNTDLSIQTPCIKRFPTILGEVLNIEWVRRKWPRCSLWSIEPLFSQSDEPVRVDAVGGACQMIPREVYQAVGGLSTKYFMYVEDIEISAAALSQGKNTYYIGAAQIIHHGGQSSGGKDRGGRWVAIMQREAIWQFFRTWRGKAYAAAYRATMALVSIAWLMTTIVLSPFLLVRNGGSSVGRVWRKWLGALQWSLRLENSTRQFRRQLSSQQMLGHLQSETRQ